MIRRLALLLIVSMVLSARAMAQQVCEDALVKATMKDNSSVHTDWRLATLVSRKVWAENSSSVGAKTELFGVPVGASYDDYHTRATDMLQSHNESYSNDQLYNIAWTGLDPNSPSDYKECLDANKLGLQLAVVSATPTKISMLVRYYGPERGKIKLSWVPPKIAGKALPSKISQGGNGLTIQVDRPKVTTDLSVNYNDNITSPVVVLEPLPLPPKVKHIGTRVTQGGDSGFSLSSNPSSSPVDLKIRIENVGDTSVAPNWSTNPPVGNPSIGSDISPQETKIVSISQLMPGGSVSAVCKGTPTQHCEVFYKVCHGDDGPCLKDFEAAP